MSKKSKRNRSPGGQETGFFVQKDTPARGKAPASNTTLLVEHQKPGFWSAPLPIFDRMDKIDRIFRLNPVHPVRRFYLCPSPLSANEEKARTCKPVPFVIHCLR